jgi:hypothetical protein
VIFSERNFELNLLQPSGIIRGMGKLKKIQPTHSGSKLTAVCEPFSCFYTNKNIMDYYLPGNIILFSRTFQHQ